MFFITKIINLFYDSVLTLCNKCLICFSLSITHIYIYYPFYQCSIFIFYNTKFPHLCHSQIILLYCTTLNPQSIAFPMVRFKNLAKGICLINIWLLPFLEEASRTIVPTVNEAWIYFVYNFINVYLNWNMQLYTIFWVIWK